MLSSFNPWCLFDAASRLESLERLATAFTAVAPRNATPQAPRRSPANRVAIVDVSGVLVKRPPWWGALVGMKDTEAVGFAIRKAAADDSVSSILLDIDSPGGSTFGIADVAQAVAEAKQRKRVVAYAGDLVASAAFWIASQAHEIIVGPTALVGSIGTLAVIRDTSARAAMEGVKVHVVSTSALKAAAVEGTPVTDAVLGEMAQTVLGINRQFLAAIARGRRMSASAVDGVATGQVWVGAAAVGQGLSDRVAFFDEVITDEIRRMPREFVLSDQLGMTPIEAKERLRSAINEAIRDECKRRGVYSQDVYEYPIACAIRTKNPELVELASFAR